MRNYTIGTHYEFIVNYYYTTIDDEGRERCWLSLSDGESVRKFNVPAYSYQRSGMEGKTIFCKVTNVLDNGYPFLQQLKSTVLHECYKEGEEYWFSVGEKAIDEKSKTKRPYYKIIDRNNGIDWHRYYCSEDTLLEGVICFRVKSVEDDFIDLELSSDTSSIAPDESSPSNYGENPFGHEDIHHEWKSSLVFSAGSMNTSAPEIDKQIQVIMRCIAGFQNAEGGLLYIGVTDNGEICGIEQDYPYLNSDEDPFTYQSDTDSYENKIRNSVDKHLGKLSLENIQFEFYFQQSSKRVFCIITVNKTPRPVYKDGRDVYKRFGNSFRLLRGEEITSLVEDKLNDTSEQILFTRPMPSGCAIFNPNRDVELQQQPEDKDSMVTLNVDFLKKLDFYYMSFFRDDFFMYSKKSHTSDNNCFSEVRFNKIDGNIEYSRDLLIKCTKDGHAQFLQAYDVCKLGDPETKIRISTSSVFLVAIVHKYDFLKIQFYKDGEVREKYIRVVSLFGKDTESSLKANKEPKDIKYQFRLKGNSLIPTGCTLKSVEVIHETLPDEIQFVSARSGAQGIGTVVGSGTIDPATY